MAMKDSTFITRVILKNYKSIAACDVRLGPLMFLVGPNGAGKSNFLDALRFVADALDSSLDHALRSRGGINDVRRRRDRPRSHNRRRNRASHSDKNPNYFSVCLNFTLPEGPTGRYTLGISAGPGHGQHQVRNEELILPEAYFSVENGIVTTNVSVAPAASTDRLYLVNASGLPEFRAVYDALSRMGFYRFDLNKIRELQAPESGDILTHDGSNLTSVFHQLPISGKQAIEEYLTKIVPGLRGVEVKRIGPKETLAFQQDPASPKHPWRFLAHNMSDGTLRALGILVALFQGKRDEQKRVPLVGIEEPEIALHPAAAGVLLDALRQTANRTQVLITSHSPDLLDNKDLDVASILAVEFHEGATTIGPVDEVGRSVVRDRLFTIGELLSIDQLQPDPAHVFPVDKARQLSLFEHEG